MCNVQMCKMLEFKDKMYNREGYCSNVQNIIAELLFIWFNSCELSDFVQAENDLEYIRHGHDFSVLSLHYCHIDSLFIY